MYTESSVDYITKIVKGLQPRERMMSALGERTSFGTTATGEDLWRGNELTPVPTSTTTIPTPDAAGEQMTVVSESVNDTAGGTGVQSVEVHYLDNNGAEQSEVVPTNGTTGVDLSVANVRFINDFHTVDVGSNGVAAGHIKIYKKSNSGLVYNMIALGGNQSLVPLKMIPANKYLVLKLWNVTEAQGKRVAFRIRSTDNEGVLNNGTFLFKGVSFLKQASSPPLFLEHKIPAFSIVKVSGWAIQVGAEASCSWIGILVDA